MYSMLSEHEVTVEQEIAEVTMGHPHVVVLGAGASRAALPHGDKNGKILPLMNDFSKVVGLETLLRDWGIDPLQNFEDTFSSLWDTKQVDKITFLRTRIEEYFESLVLPDRPTLYDHLVLSLRSTDLIATFNWDPLLVAAYRRNRNAGLALPKLAFLHGNVAVGYCAVDRITGPANMTCRHCENPFKKIPLLYPIGKKDYSGNEFIADAWQQLERGFKKAFMITIFGYSGPRTDQEAIAAMQKAWGDKSNRAMEQTAFITKQTEDEVCENWDAFIHSHHYEVFDDFYDSWIAHHPRRTGEAYLNQYLEAKFISDNPIPRELDFPELWRWYGRFVEPERAHAASKCDR